MDSFFVNLDEDESRPIPDPNLTKDGEFGNLKDLDLDFDENGEDKRFDDKRFEFIPKKQKPNSSERYSLQFNPVTKDRLRQWITLLKGYKHVCVQFMSKFIVFVTGDIQKGISFELMLDVDSGFDIYDLKLSNHYIILAIEEFIPFFKNQNFCLHFESYWLLPQFSEQYSLPKPEFQSSITKESKLLKEIITKNKIVLPPQNEIPKTDTFMVEIMKIFISDYLIKENAHKITAIKMNADQITTGNQQQFFVSNSETIHCQISDSIPKILQIPIYTIHQLGIWFPKSTFPIEFLKDFVLQCSTKTTIPISQRIIFGACLDFDDPIFFLFYPSDDGRIKSRIFSSLSNSEINGKFGNLIESFESGSYYSSVKNSCEYFENQKDFNIKIWNFSLLLFRNILTSFTDSEKIDLFSTKKMLWFRSISNNIVSVSCLPILLT